MLRGGPALATVFLCFVFVLTQKPLQANKLCSQDMIKRMNSFIKNAPKLKWLDSRLYTPSFADSQNCPISALKCFAAEIEVLTNEWKKVGENVRHFNISKMLKSYADLVNKTLGLAESDCRQCELLQEENPEKFLSDLLSTLQHMNSQFCA